MGVVPEHCTSQRPQCAGTVTSVSQPVSGSFVQFAQPGAHDVLAKLQPPAEQDTAPVTCCSVVQLWPQRPQFCASLGRHCVPHCKLPSAHNVTFAAALAALPATPMTATPLPPLPDSGTPTCDESPGWADARPLAPVASFVTGFCASRMRRHTRTSTEHSKPRGHSASDVQLNTPSGGVTWHAARPNKLSAQYRRNDVTNAAPARLREPPQLPHMARGVVANAASVKPQHELRDFIADDHRRKTSAAGIASAMPSDAARNASAIRMQDARNAGERDTADDHGRPRRQHGGAPQHLTDQQLRLIEQRSLHARRGRSNISSSEKLGRVIKPALEFHAAQRPRAPAPAARFADEAAPRAKPKHHLRARP